MAAEIIFLRSSAVLIGTPLSFNFFFAEGAVLRRFLLYAAWYAFWSAGFLYGNYIPVRGFEAS